MARAFVVRDLITDFSYKVSFVVALVDVVFGIAAFYFLSRLLPRMPQGYDAFAFILVGMAVNGAMSTSLVCFAQGVRLNQQNGTLKAILVTPTTPSLLILLSSLYPLARAAMDAGVYFAAAPFFGLSLALANAPAALLVLGVSLLAFGALGILSAAFTIVLKRGDPVVWLFGALSWLFGGVFYPIDVLPPLLQHAARLLPITYALDALRPVLLSGAALTDVLRPLGVLALFAAVGLPVSLLAFEGAVGMAKKSGTLGQS